MDNSWTEVYLTGVPYLAELAKQMLIENGIDAIIFNSQDSVYLIGDISVHVKSEDTEIAHKYIQEFEKNIKGE
jgi:hypothetical protein